MAFFSTRTRPFFRNLGIIAFMLWLSLFTAYFADTMTRRSTTSKATGNNQAEETAVIKLSEKETEDGIDRSLYGDSWRRIRIENLFGAGDRCLMSGFNTDFRSDLKKYFGEVISRDSRGEPSREIIKKTLDAHFTGKPSRACELYEQSFDTDREKGIGLMDQLLALPAEERMPLELLARYRRARLRMSLEDWGALSDDDARLRLRVIREDLASAPELARAGSLDPAKISENAAYWIAYSRSMILPSARLVALGEADYAGATEAYLRMPMRGQANSVNSCMHLLKKLCDEKNLRPALASENLRKLMTFYLCAQGGPFYESAPEGDNLRTSTLSWLDLLTEAKVDPSFARRHVAILQYRHERWRDCQETAGRLPADDPLRRLLLSRCNLRLTGEMSLSREHLSGRLPTRAPAKMTPVTMTEEYTILIDLQDESELLERVSGELGVFALCDGDFTEALRLFDQGRYGDEAFYVAECLLSIDELKSYVDKRRASGLTPVKHRWNYHREGFDDLEYELCSRLMRAGRLEEALDYVRPELRAKATTYVLLLRCAERDDLPDHERADSYWRAALMIRQIGETLLHSPHGMSWSSGSGWYVSLDYLPGYRSRTFKFNYPPPDMGILICGAEELRRLRTWESQHMYGRALAERDARYAAFDLALKAARLLPDNDPAGAQIVQYAGNLLKYREPKAAMAAHRLLITRFKQTPLGSHAARANWFSGERPEPPSDILSR
jgi:hypothetical protein